MMSLRALVRSAPRSVPRLGRFSSFSTATLARQSAARSSRLAFKSFGAAARQQQQQQVRALSASVFRGAPAGETDEELSAKLESEIQYENEVEEGEPVPASVKDFLENSAFELVDTPGKEEVALTRTFGNEKITVTFSIADLANYEPDQFDEDSALGDEDGELSATPGADRASRTGDAGAAAEADEEFGDDDGGEAAVPCRLSIVVEKAGQGALNIEAVAQDGSVVVENLYYYGDAALAHGRSADVQHAAQGVYPGPPFGSLDEDLQILMQRYLEERGITEALAVFVPDYMDLKEQREYLAWLNNVKSFIDA